MKRFFALMIIMAPLMLGAQNKHAVEVGGGYSVLGEMTLDGPWAHRYAMNLYSEYRYNVWKGLSFGAQYQLMPNWGDTVLEEKEGRMLTSKGVTQTFNVLAEYKLFSRAAVSPFIGIGAGPQFDFARLSSDTNWTKWGADLHMRVGFELFHKFRLTGGHLHSCHHLPRALRAAQPAYYLSAGWVF